MKNKIIVLDGFTLVDKRVNFDECVASGGLVISPEEVREYHSLLDEKGDGLCILFFHEKEPVLEDYVMSFVRFINRFLPEPGIASVSHSAAVFLNFKIADLVLVKSAVRAAIGEEMNVDGDVAEALDKKVRTLIMGAEARAKAKGRNTILEREV